MKQKNSIPRTIKFTCMTLLLNALFIEPLKGINLQTALSELTSALNGLARTLTSIPVFMPHTPTHTYTPTPMPVQSTPSPSLPETPSTPTTRTTNAFLSATLESKMPLCTSRDAIILWINLDLRDGQKPEDKQRDLTNRFVKSAQQYIEVLKVHQAQGLSGNDITQINRGRCPQSLESIVKSIEDTWKTYWGTNQPPTLFVNQEAQDLANFIAYEKSTNIYPPPS